MPNAWCSTINKTSYSLSIQGLLRVSPSRSHVYQRGFHTTRIMCSDMFGGGDDGNLMCPKCKERSLVATAGKLFTVLSHYSLLVNKYVVGFFGVNVAVLASLYPLRDNHKSDCYEVVFNMHEPIFIFPQACTRAASAATSLLPSALGRTNPSAQTLKRSLPHWSTLPARKR